MIRQKKIINNEYIIRIFYIVSMGIGFPIMRFTSMHFETVVNNGVRFLSGGLIFLLIAAFKYPSEFKKFICSPLLIFELFFISCFLSGNTYFLITGLKSTSALAGSIFGILAMPLSATVTAIFFEDEREIVKKKNFHVGGIIAIIGALTFVIYGSDKAGGLNFQAGSIFLGIGIFIQSIQNLFIKRIIGKLPVILITSSIATFSSLIFLTLAVHTGKIIELQKIGKGMIVGLILAGIYGIFTGMFIATYIMKKQGLVTFNLLKLLVPVSTAIGAYFTLGEKINLYQGIGATIAIFGCMLALKKNRN